MIRKYSGSRLVFITRVRRLVFVDSCSSLVAAPPPLAPNTRTIFVHLSHSFIHNTLVYVGRRHYEP